MNDIGKLGKLIIVGAFAGSLLAGCSWNEEAASAVPDPTENAAAVKQSPDASEGAVDTPESDAAQEAVPKGESSKAEMPEASVAEPLNYSADQKQKIIEAAEKSGLKKVYVPSVGLGTDEDLDRVESRENEIRIVFIRGVITESSKPLKPTAGVLSSRKVKISDQLTGEWIKDEGGPEYLYYEIEGTYFSMKSAKDFDQSEYIAAAASLQELK